MNNLKSILTSFKIKDDLNSKIWIETKNGYVLRPNIRERLLEIANEFFESLNVDVVISDVTFTGSLANYNWSNFSDIDLHLIADFGQFNKEDLPLYEELFLLKKTVFNDKHDIKIKGYEVELYVQDENEEHTSTGVYSVLNDEWITEPSKEMEEIDTNYIKKKSEKWMKEIDSVLDLVEEESLDEAKNIIKKFKEKIKKYRQCGLEKGGEFSVENLVFKVLRRNGYIQKLFDAQTSLVDKNLSLNEDKIEDPKLSEPEKSKNVKPNTEEFYKTLENIDSNIYQEEAGNYTIQKDVETVQIALDILGYELPRFGVDGKFGPETALAVNKFKKDNNVVDSSTKETPKKINENYQGKTIAGIDELCYNPVTKSGGIIGYGYNNEKASPQNWKNHETHLHIGFTNRDVAMEVIEKAKEMGLYPTENWYANGKVKDVHTKNSFHYRVFDGTPKVSAGLDIGDGKGKKRDVLTDLIRWIYDKYEGTSLAKTKVVGFDNGVTQRGATDMEVIASVTPKIGDKAFISPEMADKLIEKLKEKDVKPEDLEKYTKFKVDFSDTIVSSDEDFYNNILDGIGAPKSAGNMRFLLAWRQAEGGKATNNPFNTTYKLKSDSKMSNYNSVGVKNYSTPQYGLEATVRTLKLKYYTCIVDGLKNNVDPDEIASCPCMKTWGTGEGVSRVLASNKLRPKPIAVA